MNKNITVPDMMCSNCEKRLVGLTTKLAGVQSIAATHENHQMTIEFDELQISIDQIVAEVIALGFHPEPE
jgi:copper chaperone CopZ